MRFFAVLADIHANYQALLAVEQDALRRTGGQVSFVSLGDVVDYGPQPNECMAWVRTHARIAIQGNHDRHAAHSVAMFRDKFWLSLALTIPVVFWSTDVQHWLGYTAPSFPGSKFIPAILGTAVSVYGGLVFIRGAWGELADHKLGMMTLISLAIVVAFGMSLASEIINRLRSLYKSPLPNESWSR